MAVFHNSVLADTNITTHAEINGLLIACRVKHFIFLPKSTVAATCEPCPMCMAALHWARVNTVYYGATIDDAVRAGFNELKMPAADLLRQGGSKVRLVPSILRDECTALFDEWKKSSQHRAY